MKYNAQNLARALFKIIKEDPRNYQAIITGFVNFCKTKHLIYLLPNLLKYIEIEAKKEGDIKTLKIFSAAKLEENILKDIQKLSGAESSGSIEVIEDKDIIAGFVVYYQNKIIDASLINNLHLLRNKLTNA